MCEGSSQNPEIGFFHNRCFYLFSPLQRLHTMKQDRNTSVYQLSKSYAKPFQMALGHQLGEHK